MSIILSDHQIVTIEKMKPGSILCADPGTGKSRTALAYYYTKICKGKIEINGESVLSPMKNPLDICIITTAKKRDALDWEAECVPFLISKNPDLNISGVRLTVDSWNNIEKYVHVNQSFFIFDEQRVVGSGAWVKSFLKICKNNLWILLSATPGDTWMDYIPVFIANGFYKNRTEFISRHVIYSPFTKFPKIDRYIEIGTLHRHRDSILVTMRYKKHTVSHDKIIITAFDVEAFDTIMVKRWNFYEDKPVKETGELCYLMRKVVNSDPDRLSKIEMLLTKHPCIIIFYNFNYELELLLGLSEKLKIPIAQWNGHKHEDIPIADSWLYLVQYTAGAEGWNCIKTDTIVFYSQSYSYKAMIQAAGRIDRLNTPFIDLYYYYFRSNSVIDLGIHKALKNKQNFNESMFLNV